MLPQSQASSITCVGGAGKLVSRGGQGSAGANASSLGYALELRLVCGGGRGSESVCVLAALQWRARVCELVSGASYTPSARVARIVVVVVVAVRVPLLRVRQVTHIDSDRRDIRKKAPLPCTHRTCGECRGGGLFYVRMIVLGWI
jgi:hypothetical protein